MILQHNLIYVFDCQHKASKGTIHGEDRREKVDDSHVDGIYIVIVA